MVYGNILKLQKQNEINKKSTIPGRLSNKLQARLWLESQAKTKLDQTQIHKQLV